MDKLVNIEETPKKNWMGVWLVFFLTLAAEIVGIYYLIYVNGYLMGDALARTANAYYVLFTEPPRLASLGFVWNPLPSFLQLPILLFTEWFRPLVTHGIAGGLVTAISMSVNAAFLYHCFKKNGTNTLASLALIALFVFNPFFFFYSCNGMSEIPFFTTMIICVYNLAKWFDKRSTINLLMVALSLVFSFLCRYEAFAIALGVGISIIIIIYFSRDEFSSIKEKTLKLKTDYTIATGVLVFLPMLYTVGVWIFLNWTVMGDPLFFLTSDYSNASQTALLGKASIISRIIHVAIRLLPFIPIFAAITLERILTGRIFKLDYWILVSMCASITLFHFLMYITGSSYGWLRFHAFIPPICMGWLPYELSKLKGNIRKLSIVVFAAALIISSAITFVYLGIQEYSPEEYEAIYMNDINSIAVQRQMAKTISESYINDGLILIESTQFALILNIDNTDNLISGSFENFEDAVKTPWLFNIHYIVVERPAGIGASSPINKAYPRLFYDGADWCVEREEFYHIKIFEITY